MFRHRPVRMFCGDGNGCKAILKLYRSKTFLPFRGKRQNIVKSVDLINFVLQN